MLFTGLSGRFVAVMVALGCFAPMPLRANPADVLLLNGRIVTLDGASSINEALAITGERITATGSGGKIIYAAGPFRPIGIERSAAPPRLQGNAFMKARIKEAELAEARSLKASI
jgi:hypothetical protein